MSGRIHLFERFKKQARGASSRRGKRSRFKSALSYLAVGWCSISAAYAGSHRLECVAGQTTTVNYHLCTAGFPGTDCLSSDPNDTLFVGNAPQGTKVTFTTTYENFTLKPNGTASDIPFSVTFDAPNTEFSPAHHDATYANIGSQDVFETFAQGTSAEKTFSLNILQPGGKADHLLDVLVTCDRPVQQTGSITIKKQVAAGGGDGTFTFNVVNPTPATGGTIPSPVSITTSGGQGSSPTFSNLGTGQYQITESDPTAAGFKFDNATCDGGGPAVSGSTLTVNLTGGASITCTFTNSKLPPVGQGTLVIVKNSGSSDGTFIFNASGGTLTNFSITTSGGTGSQSFTLNPGSYSVAEVVPTQWSFVSLACTESGGTNSTLTSASGMTATIGLDANETVTCTYVNKFIFVPPTTSSITFRKQIAGGGADGTFNFTAVNPQTTTGTIPAFAITTSGGAGASSTFSNLSAGQYQITESDPTAAGFRFDNVSCDNGASSTTSTLTINLTAGMSVICTFTNSVLPAPGTGSITIIKNTNGLDATFSFTASGGTLANFSITTSSSAGNKAFNNLPAGNYTVTENALPQWNFASLVCLGDIAGKPNTTSVTGTTAHIGLDAGEEIVCTYVNKSTFTPPPIARTASLTVVKTTNGRDGTFAFSTTVAGHQSFSLTTIEASAKVSFDVTAGTYSVTETGVGGTGWSFQSVTCIGAAASSANTASKSVTVSISSGTAVICIFQNFFDEQFIRSRTSDTIRNFMNKRADILLSEEPDRNRLIRRMAGSLWGDTGGDASPVTFTGSTSASASGLLPDGTYASTAPSTSGQMKFATSFNQMMQAAAHAERESNARNGGTKAPTHGFDSDLDVWLEAHYGYSTESRLGYDRTGNYGVIYTGADYLFGRNLLVGALVQVDTMTDNWKSTGASVKGNGWMTGPYATVRLSENLFLDGRLAWGESSNKVNPFGTYEDPFNTQRGLARVNLTGNWVFNSNFRITPSVAVSYFTEHQFAYTDSLGVYIPSQDVSLGRVTFGPEFGYRFSPSPSWTLEPHVALMGVWDFQKDGTMTIQGLTVGTQDIRARVQGGFMARNLDNFSLRWTVSYDGIGDKSLNVYGTQLWVNVPLNAAAGRWPVKAPPVRWTGAYLGAQFGAGQANYGTNFFFGGGDAPGTIGNSADKDVRGMAGLFAGYNFRWDKIVAGIEADVSFRGDGSTNEHLLFAVPGDSDDRFFVRNTLGTTGSLRGRLGYAWNRSLLYGTAGLAWGRVRTDIRSDGGPDLDLPAAIYSQSGVRLGWTAGLGVEHYITDNWSVRGEFRYSQFGGRNFVLTDPALQPDDGPNASRTGVSLTQGLIGVGYRF